MNQCLIYPVKVETLGVVGTVLCLYPQDSLVCLSFSLGPSVVGLALYSHVSQCSPPRKELYDHYLPKGKLVTAKILR